MGSSYGENIKLTIFGQSHSEAIGMVLEGLPAGVLLDTEAIERFMARRAPGNSPLSTARKEADRPVFVSGLAGGRTCGAPLTALIYNTDARPGDYEKYRNVPRPGHADYTASVKYNGFADYSGGGHFSGRLTAPLCVAGAICIQLLGAEGIWVRARAAEIGGVADDEAKMHEVIAAAKAAGDSVGGIVECVVDGLSAGLGDPMFGGMENRIAAAIFGIPAVKGIEFGAGFGAAKLKGSENNDGFRAENGRVVTETNNAGGILGGITDGMPLTFRVAFKPTPSIAIAQHSVELDTLSDTEVCVGGRHDPCVVPRAVPCVEAAAALAVYDAFIGRKREI